MNTIYNCKVCDKILSGKQRTFCSIQCKNDYFQDYNRLKQRALKRKQSLVSSLRGCCSVCGYKKSLSALSFYDQSGNSLHLDINKLANNNIDKIKKELLGARVLCRNCYEELRDPQNNHHTVPDQGNVELCEQTTRKFSNNLKKYGMQSDQTLILAVSGGVDSITMLDLFAKSDLKLNIVVAHLNHNVRDEADKDAEFVKTLTKQHNYPFIYKKLTDTNYSGIRKNTRIVSANLEEYLRDERKKFLLKTANDNDASFVALAHNADDQAETFIMNALRGSGPAGLGAMSMHDDMIFRPLLNISRAEIENYANVNSLEWHEDITNQDTTYTRNYIRHEILPLLSRVNPDFLNSIWRTTHIQRKTNELLKDEAQKYITKALDSSHQLRMTTEMRELPKPILYEAFGLLYERAKGDRKNLSLKHLESIEKLVANSSGTKSLDLPDDVEVKLTYDKLDFTRKISDNIAPTKNSMKLKIGTNRWGAWVFDVSKNINGKMPHGKNEVTTTSFENITVRIPKIGDRISSKGLKGRKKLQDLFVDAKIDRVRRATWPVFENSDSSEIIWVPKLAISEAISKEKNNYIIKIDEDKDEVSEEE